MLKSAPIRIILGLLSAVAVFGLFSPFFVYLLFETLGDCSYNHLNQSIRVEFNREQRRYFNIILFFLFLIPVLAHGHPPYEKLERVVETEQGEKIKLVRIYWDGIVKLDPVQLVAYDESAFPFFETSTGRDVFVSCKEKNDCFVFLFKGFLSVFPEEVYEIKNQSVVSVDEFWTNVRGAFIPIQRIENYLVAMVFLFASLLIGFYSNRMRKEKRELVAAALLLSGLFSLFVFVCVVDVSRVLFLPLTALTGIVAAVGLVIYRIFRKRVLTNDKPV